MTKLRDLKGFEDAFPGETLFVDEKGNENFGEYMDNISDVNVVVDEEELAKVLNEETLYTMNTCLMVSKAIAAKLRFIRLEKSDDK